MFTKYNCMKYCENLYNHSILSNLRTREICGTVSRNIKHQQKYAYRRMFNRIPARLAISLKSIVDEHILMEEAHVFLGFNGDGTYVISYTESFEAIDQTGFPCYVYRLHWWLFRLYKKMVRSSTVRLFANEEITSSLRLSYAEWPKEKSKVVVYGCSKDSDNCYITVTAVPPTEPCENCTLIKSKKSYSIRKTKCLCHGFVAHMKYTSVSTLSAVLNAVGLQIDGLMVLNMGHSIGVISLGVLESIGNTENLPLNSIKGAAYEDKPFLNENDDCAPLTNVEKSVDLVLSPRLNMTSLNSKLQNFADAEFMDKFSFTAEFSHSFTVSSENSQDTCTSTQFSSPKLQSNDSFLSSSTVTSSELLTPQWINANEDSDNSQECNCNQLNKQDIYSQENFNNNANSCDILSLIDPYIDPEPKSIVLPHRVGETVAKQKSDLCNTENESTFNHSKLCNFSHEPSENCCCGIVSNKQCSEHGKPALPMYKNFGIRNDTLKDNHDFNIVDVKPQSRPKQSPDLLSPRNKLSSVKPCRTTCLYCGLKLCEPNYSHDSNKNKKKELSNNASAVVNRSPLVGSPGRNHSKLLILSSIRNGREQQENFLELNAPTPSPSASESSGSVYCTGDAASQISYKSGNYRRTDGIVSFFETLYGTLGEPSNHEDTLPVSENNLFYGPVTFEGADGIPLSPLKPEGCDDSAAFSQHLVLDVEHVIFDVLRTRCYTTYKFGYLIDYDVQIIDNCPNTRSVIILIVALLNIAPRKGKIKQQDYCRFNSSIEPSISKSQQFQFFISWKLQTGRYEVVAATPLQHFDEKKSGKWNAKWVVDTRNIIRRACALPQSYRCSVHVLNNASVFREKSLNYLWDTDHIIALRK